LPKARRRRPRASARNATRKRTFRPRYMTRRRSRDREIRRVFYSLTAIPSAFILR
jgi:hypothetical protein